MDVPLRDGSTFLDGEEVERLAAELDDTARERFQDEDEFTGLRLCFLARSLDVVRPAENAEGGVVVESKGVLERFHVLFRTFSTVLAEDRLEFA